MIETSMELEMEEHNISNSSVHENSINEDQKTSASIKCNPVEALHRTILDELIDDAILEVCFDVHKVERLGDTEKYEFNRGVIPDPYFGDTKVEIHRQGSHCRVILSSSSSNSSIDPDVAKRLTKYLSTANRYNIEDNSKEKTVHCYVCSRRTNAYHFCKHLAMCMGETFRRSACRKIQSFRESDCDSESSDSDFKPSSSKKKIRKGSSTKGEQSKGNSVSSQSSENSLNYKDMTQGEIKAFINQHCGVISKRSKMPCKNTLNCSQHTKEEKTTVRSDLLSDMNGQNPVSDQITENEMIDVDSIDDDIGGQQTIMPS